MPRASLLPLLLLGLSLLLGCSGRGASGEGSTGTSKGSVAPPFALPHITSAGRFNLEEQRGKVVLLSFWASWCGPCRVELPALEAAWSQYRNKDVVFVGVSVDDNPLAAEQFLKEVPLSFPNVIDTSGDVAGGAWRVASLPTTIVLDRRGVVRARHLGYTPRQFQQSLNLIDDLLEESAP